MPESPGQILLVTPVWNDSERLETFGAELARVLAESPLPIRWIIADDGSTRDAPGRLAALRDRFAEAFPRVEVHFADAHHGKGSVVREAWALVPDAALLAFVDADGSVTAEEMLGLIEKAVAAGQSVIAVRKRTATTQVVESPWRGIAHRGFLVAARLLLGLRCADVQCGAKVFHGEEYRRIAPRLVEKGLAFDSELLFALERNGAKWIETPVNWVEKKGGKVKPMRDGWRMLRALCEIRMRAKSWLSIDHKNFKSSNSNES